MLTMTRKNAYRLRLYQALAICLVVAAAPLPPGAATPQTVYEGTGGDFEMAVAENGVAAPASCPISVIPGDELTFQVFSPGGSLEGSPYVLSVERRPGGETFPMQADGIHIAFGTAPSLSSGSNAFDLLVVHDGADTISITIPASQVGYHFLFQGLTSDPVTGEDVTTTAFEVVVQ